MASTTIPEIRISEHELPCAWFRIAAGDQLLVTKGYYAGQVLRVIYKSQWRNGSNKFVYCNKIKQ